VSEREEEELVEALRARANQKGSGNSNSGFVVLGGS